MALLIEEVVPDRKIGIALDEYNVKYPPQPEAHSMHEQDYTLRDGLYITGMLNMFHRQCQVLKIADLALLVNTLPVICKPKNGPAFPSALFFPFRLYSHMEKQVLEVITWTPEFAVMGLGLNISPRNNVPYLDLTVTRSEDGRRLTLGIANRHPLREAKIMVNLKGEDAPVYKSKEAWLMLGKDPLAANTVAEPENIELYTGPFWLAGYSTAAGISDGGYAGAAIPGFLRDRIKRVPRDLENPGELLLIQVILRSLTAQRT